MFSTTVSNLKIIKKLGEGIPARRSTRVNKDNL